MLAWTSQSEYSWKASPLVWLPPTLNPGPACLFSGLFSKVSLSIKPRRTYLPE